MDGGVNRAFVFLFLTVLTILCCCLGLTARNKACESQGGHFEVYWAGEIMVCVGEEK